MTEATRQHYKLAQGESTGNESRSGTGGTRDRYSKGGHAHMHEHADHHGHKDVNSHHPQNHRGGHSHDDTRGFPRGGDHGGKSVHHTKGHSTVEHTSHRHESVGTDG